MTLYVCMNDRDLAVFEDARMLANRAAWSIELQIRRLNLGNFEIEGFVMQPFVDFHYLLIAIGRLEKAGKLAGHVIDMSTELERFKSQLPWLPKLRNAMEHIDDYQLGKGRDASVRTGDLHVFSGGKDSMHWVGVEVEYKAVVQAASCLLEFMQAEWERITRHSSGPPPAAAEFQR
jgi:hypothetical protein